MGRDRCKFYDTSYPYFCTCSIKSMLTLFAYPEITAIILKGLEFMHDNGVRYYAYVIMENHLHLVAQHLELGSFLGRFKSYTARCIVDMLVKERRGELLKRVRAFHFSKRADQKFIIWDTGSHPKELGTPTMMRQKIAYIHKNPVQRGYVDNPEEWRYSSARNYAGLPSVLPIDEFDFV